MHTRGAADHTAVLSIVMGAGYWDAPLWLPCDDYTATAHAAHTCPLIILPAAAVSCCHWRHLLSTLLNHPRRSCCCEMALMLL